MPLWLKTQLDDKSLDDTRRDAQSAFEGIGEMAGGRFLAGMTSQLDQIGPSFVRIGSMAESALGGISTESVVAAAGITAIGAAALVVGEQLYSVGARFDAISDSIAARTGKIGSDLDALNTSMMNAGRTTASSLEDIADNLGQLSVAFDGLGGRQLEDLTKQVSDLERMTGEALNVRDFGRALRAFGEDASEAGPALDELYNASANTLEPINELLAAMVQVGPAARSLGLDFNETAGLLVTFEESGINASRTVFALNQAANNFAEHNIDLKTGLADTITQMKGFIDAGNEAAALQLAKDVFGARGAQLFVDAVRNGRLTVDSLQVGLDKTGTTIKDLNTATADWAETWRIVKNRITEAADEIGGPLFNAVNRILQETLQPTPLLPTTSTPAPGQQPLSPANLLPGLTQGGVPTGDIFGVPTLTPPGFSPVVPGSQSFYGQWYPNQPQDIAGQLADQNKPGTAARPGRPAVPYPAEYGQPMQPGETFEDWQQRQRVMEAEHDVAEKKAVLAQLEATLNDQDQENNATADELTNARNDIAQAEARVYAVEQQNLKTRRSTLDSVQVPYGPGYGAAPLPGQTAEDYARTQATFEATHKRQQAEAELAQVRADPKSSPNDIIKAENDLATARQNEYQAMLRLSDSTSKASEQLGDIGVQLDKDFGASEGLPGLAENLFKFLANLAFSPVMGAMRGVQAGLGFPGGQGAGSGLAGIIGSALLPQGTSAGVPSLSGTSPGASALGPAGLQPAAQTGTRMPYGLTPEQVKAGQFPDWVTQLGAQFGLTPSTYQGHQTTGESGQIKSGPVLPNPQHLNRGIDWTGSPENMAAFAQYLQSTGLAEQVIYQGDQAYTYPAGVDYSQDLSGHTGHVHTRFSQSPGALTPGMSGIRANQQTGSSNNLTAALQQAGIDPRMYPLIQAFSVAEGNNPSGVPTLGFADIQAGPTLGQHSQALAQQLRTRQAVVGPFPYGGSPQAQAAWMADVVGQQGVQSDWQGRAQPPRDAYIGSILQNWPGMQEGGPVLPDGAVPIIAHQGEHVLPKEDVDAMGGQDAVYSFRAGLQAANAGNAPPGQQPAIPQQVPGAQMPDVSGTAGGPLAPSTPIGSAPPPTGYGPGFSVTGGGLVGMLESLPSTAINYAISAGMMAAAGAARFGGAIEDLPSYEGGGGVGAPMGGSPGGATSMAGEPAGALISAAINIAMEELNAAISAGGQAIAAGVGGLQQTFGLQQFAQTSLGQQSWITRLVGGLMGAQPQLPNLAGLKSIPPPASTGPGTAASDLAGKSGGPLVNIQNYHAASDHAAGADIARHVEAGYAASSAALNGGR